MAEREKNNDTLKLSENQLKILKQRYLKKNKKMVVTEKPEDLFRRVSRNIALSDLLYDERIDKNKITNNISYTQTTFDIYGNKTDLLLIHEYSYEDENRITGKKISKQPNMDQRDKNFKKFIANLDTLAKQEDTAKKIVDETEEKFYKLLTSFDFLPNSPTLMNAGRDLQQLSACYVLPIPDSMEGIFDSLKNTALIHKSGGGTGFSFNNLRSKYSIVKTTKGVASGPISFMKIYNGATEEVKQGGTRRGANMGILRYDHPQIEEFIDAKKDENELQNFNLSIATDEKFWKLVEEDGEYKLVDPHDPEAIDKTVKAKEIFGMMCKAAWEKGDPGFVNLDAINNSKSNPTPELGLIESTNPCGEQPLLPNEPCNLGSINLANFVKNRGVDYKRLKEIVYTSVHFLDNVIDVNNYPLGEIELMAKSNRRIGLGVMGFAEMNLQLGISYGSEESIKVAEEVMKFINENAHKASIELAKKRGVFPNFKNSIYDKNGKNFKGDDEPLRNCALTTIAPTGTIGILAGLQGAGIEPFIAIAYKRLTADGIEDLKRGEEPKNEHILYEFNPIFKEDAEKHNYWGFTEKELSEKIVKNHGSIQGIKEIPEEIQKLYVTAHDIHPEKHIKSQAAFQKYVDNAVSKTINMKNSATVEDVETAYLLAYKLGCKGLTIYRDGSKEHQVLVTGKNAEKDEKKLEQIVIQERPTSLRGVTDKIKTGYGNLYVTINEVEGKPFEVFAQIGKSGYTTMADTEAICRLISLGLRSGVTIEHIIEQLQGIGGQNPVFSETGLITSIPDAIAKVLGRYYGKKNNHNSNEHHHAANQNSKLENNPIPNNIANTSSQNIGYEFCPECQGPLSHVEGCLICSCGYSKC